MADYKLRCADCGGLYPEDAYHIHCPGCAGFLEVELDRVPDAPVDPDFGSIFRYHPLMPYDPVRDDIARFEDMPASPTAEAPRLSELLGVEVFFKDETALPTGTWKDREGFVSLHRLLRAGIEDMVVFSSGNTGTSLARSASLVRGPRLHMVIPEQSRRRVESVRHFFDPEYVKVHYAPGSNDECIVAAQRLADERGYAVEGGFANYARREGLKLLALEAVLDWGQPVDWYVQAVAGGIGIYSYHKAYRDLGRAGDCPRLMGVQAAICAPMTDAWEAGAATLEERHVPREVVPSDFVRVLRTRRPADSYPVLKKIMDAVDGRFEKADDAQIHEALRLFYLDDHYRRAHRETGRLVGLEPATALAGLVKAVRRGTVAKGSRVLLNVSGAAKLGDVRPEWLADLLD